MYICNIKQHGCFVLLMTLEVKKGCAHSQVKNKVDTKYENIVNQK